MNAFTRTAAPAVALSIAVLTLSAAPALAAHRTISITNNSAQEIHMQVVSKTPDGAQNVWSGVLDKPLGARPNSTGVDFEDHDQPFHVIFSASGCDVSTQIAPNQAVRMISMKNCVVSVQ